MSLLYAQGLRLSHAALEKEVIREDDTLVELEAMLSVDAQIPDNDDALPTCAPCCG